MTNRANTIALALTVVACSAEGDRESGDAIVLALEDQTALMLDETLADEYDGVLARAREVGAPLGDIHALPPYDLNRVSMRVSRADLAEAWRQGEVETGDESVDELLGKIGASRIDSLTNLEERFILHFSETVKVDRLAAELSQIDGISAEPMLIDQNSGSDIELDPAEGGWLLTFYGRWGDCPSGCLEEHFWRVSVPTDGAATLLEEGGDPLPAAYLVPNSRSPASPRPGRM